MTSPEPVVVLNHRVHPSAIEHLALPHVQTRTLETEKQHQTAVSCKMVFNLCLFLVNLVL